MGLKLFLIYRKKSPSRASYDFYDSAVVCADSPDTARSIHPKGDVYPSGTGWTDGTWLKHPKHVHVEYIGDAVASQDTGVILASFVAG